MPMLVAQSDFFPKCVNVSQLCLEHSASASASSAFRRYRIPSLTCISDQASGCLKGLNFHPAKNLNVDNKKADPRWVRCMVKVLAQVNLEE